MAEKAAAGEVEVKEDGRLVVLRGEKLRTLAKLIYYAEADRIKTLAFMSEYERSHYLIESREAYLMALSLTKEASHLTDYYITNNNRQDLVGRSDSTPHELVSEYIEYVGFAVQFAVAGLKNVNLRYSYLKKVQNHAKELYAEIQSLNGLNPSEAAEKAKEFLEKIDVFKKSTYEALVNKASKSSKLLAKAFKEPPLDFSHMVERCRLKLALEKGIEYNKPFSELTTEQQIEVYGEVLKSSGQGAHLTGWAWLQRGLSVAGGAILVATIAMSAYDVYHSDNKFGTAAKEASELAGGYYAGEAGEAIATAAATYIVPTALIEASALVATVVGLGAIVTGFVAGMAAAWLIGWAFDEFILSGGQHAGVVGNSTYSAHTKTSSAAKHITQLHFYESPSPDGFVLACQLAHQGDIIRKHERA